MGSTQVETKAPVPQVAIKVTAHVDPSAAPNVAMEMYLELERALKNKRITGYSIFIVRSAQDDPDQE